MPNGKKGGYMKTEIIDLPKEHPDHQGIYWAAACMFAGDDKRDHIRHIYVDKNSFTVTDGNRIHHYQSQNEYENGFYEVIVKNRNRIFLKSNGTEKKYPKYESILKPDKVEPFYVSMLKKNCYFAYSQIIRHLENDILNYKFLNDLLKFNDTFDCYVGGDQRPVVFISGESKKAALMTMRVAV